MVTVLEKKEATNEEIVKKWKEAKKIFELYPQIVEEIRSGRYLTEYDKMIKEIVKSLEK